MTEKLLLCTPIYIPEGFVEDFEKAEIIPGVSLEKLDNSFKEFFATQVVYLGFAPNLVIIIDKNPYETELLKRLERQDFLTKNSFQNLNVYEDEFGIYHSGFYGVIKQILMSLILVHSSSFHVDKSYVLSQTTDDNGVIYKMEQTISYTATQRINHLVADALTTKTNPKINIEELKEIAFNLDYYYNFFFWSDDQLAVSLNSLWSAICTPYVLQTYLGFMTSIEALLNTSSEGITHIVAERIAILLTKNREERFNEYNNFKHMYSNRSKLAHGRRIINKKVNFFERKEFFITANITSIPDSELNKLAQKTINLIKVVLRDNVLVGAIQSTVGDLSKYEKRIGEIYNSRLFD